jgi:hypothetical protein
MVTDQPLSDPGCRVAHGSEASPSAGVIDSQSVKTKESRGVRGYGAGKKVKGRKRHIITDTYGFLAQAIIQQRERIKRQTIEYRRLQHRKLAA